VELEDALDMVFSAEEIEGFRCEGCGGRPGASKQLSIEQLPRSLVIQVKRFQQGLKLRGHISCPLSLNMLRYCTAAMEAWGPICPKTGVLEEPDQRALEQLRLSKAAMYSLKVVVEHRGKGLNSGHFVAYVLIGSRWYLCNDKNVSVVRSGVVILQVYSIPVLHISGSQYCTFRKQLAMVLVPC
jgi:ubiquitin carboxyl-terminal hydrolase 22/27/51